MTTRMHPTVRATCGALLLLGMWQLAAAGAGSSADAAHLSTAVLLLASAAALFCTLTRRVRSEDRVLRQEADLCRERGARSRADDAVAEADLLLARIRGRSGTSASSGHDPVSQLGLVQAELMQMQNGAANPAIAARIDLLRTRLELVSRAVRLAARTAENG
jgi:hypothetical protein